MNDWINLAMKSVEDAKSYLDAAQAEDRAPRRRNAQPVRCLSRLIETEKAPATTGATSATIENRSPIQGSPSPSSVTHERRRDTRRLPHGRLLAKQVRP